MVQVVFSAGKAVPLWGLLLSWGLTVWRAWHIKTRLAFEDLKNENYKPPPNKWKRQEEGRSVTTLILRCVHGGRTRAQSRHSRESSQCCCCTFTAARAGRAVLTVMEMSAPGESRRTAIIPMNGLSTLTGTTDLLCTPARTKPCKSWSHQQSLLVRDFTPLGQIAHMHNDYLCD